MCSSQWPMSRSATAKTVLVGAVIMLAVVVYKTALFCGGPRQPSVHYELATPKAAASRFHFLRTLPAGADEATLLTSSYSALNSSALLVHLDLKGAPPNSAYLKSLLPLLKELGANGLLVEWEDTFPYSATLQPLAAGFAYTDAEVRDFLAAAHALGFLVIPLVQTFGHLEFALKHKAFQHLRELPNDPRSIDACAREHTMAFIEMLIDQVLALHPDARYLHIGCDEVYNVGLGATCKKELNTIASLDRHDLFLRHVAQVAQYVRAKYPHVQPIIWDDMLRVVSLQKIKNYKLKDYVQPMVWHYGHQADHFPTQIFAQYGSIFDNIWFASAFKGADGAAQYLPDIKSRLVNNLLWLHTAEQVKRQAAASVTLSGLTIRGLVLTGWSRFDHLGPLCELLPAAMPSLALCLHLLRKGRLSEADINYISRLFLQCTGSSAIPLHGFREPVAYRISSNIQCDYPGGKLYKLLLSYHNDFFVLYSRAFGLPTYASGYLHDFYVKHDYISPSKIYMLVTNWNQTQNYVVNELRPALQKELERIYDKSTALEWIWTHIDDAVNHLQLYMDNLPPVDEFRVWPRQPIPV